jgi:heme/copper-type cytochrome/quinol oxidase subunit 1
MFLSMYFLGIACMPRRIADYFRRLLKLKLNLFFWIFAIFVIVLFFFNINVTKAFNGKNTNFKRSS